MNEITHGESSTDHCHAGGIGLDITIQSIGIHDFSTRAFRTPRARDTAKLRKGDNWLQSEKVKEWCRNVQKLFLRQNLATVFDSAYKPVVRMLSSIVYKECRFCNLMSSKFLLCFAGESVLLNKRESL